MLRPIGPHRQLPVLQPRATAAQTEEWLLTGLILLLPFTRLVQVNIVGTLFLHDILTFPVLFFLLLRPGAFAALQPLRTGLILMGIWLLGAMGTDYLRAVPLLDYARGWSRIIILGGNIMLLWLLCRGRLRNLSLYVLSLGVTLILNPFVNPTDLSGADPWKFGMGYGVALLVAASFNFPAVRRITPHMLGATLLGCVALLSLYLNARSAFAITGLAATYAAFAGYVARHPDLGPRINPGVFIAIIVLGFLLSNLLLAGYGELAAQGLLGAAARAKYYLQSGGSGVGLLLGGRPESLVSVQAIWDSPFVGHGSWAKDPYYTHLFQATLRSVGLLVPDDYRDIGRMTEFLIPTHSHLLGSWVEAGILSLPFWLWTVYLAFSALYSAIRVHWQPNILVALMSLSLLWDVLFSPFANDARIVKAIEICVLMCAIGMLKLRPMPETANPCNRNPVRRHALLR